MRIITPKQLVEAKKTLNQRHIKRIAYVFGGLVGIFILINLVLLVMYRGKALPGTHLGTVNVGGKAGSELPRAIPTSKLIPESVVLKRGDKSQKVAVSDLGISIDWNTAANKLSQHGLLPLIKLFNPSHVVAPLSVDTARFATAVKSLNNTFSTPATLEHITFAHDSFVIVLASGAQTVNSTTLQKDLIQTLSLGKSTIILALKQFDAPHSSGVITPQLTALQKQLSLKIKLVHGTQSKQLTVADIGSLYVESGQTMQLSTAKLDALISAVAKEFKITATNASTIRATIERALSHDESTTAVFVASGDTITKTYCTAVRDVSDSYLPELRSKLAATYSDPRGWNLSGRVAFVYAASGCDYTVWLSAASSMPSFGGVCDSTYSCRSGNNVVINFDRWATATDPWNAAGGSLEDYRVMVINHETGHWLGFSHAQCPGTGQAAPVMMQQSINLGGCVFNPWPTTQELATLKSRLGLL